MGIKRSIKAWRASRNVADELNSLSKRELDDMGITRSDIARIAREAARDVI